MQQVARAAVGTIQPGIDSQAISLGLLGYLVRRNLQIQHFWSAASFTAFDTGREVTGRQSRHLDSWLMTPEVCREVFMRGARDADAALVNGRFCNQQSVQPQGMESSRMDVLCQWLGLPKIVILDTPTLGRCMLPCRPEADAVLLDRVSSREEFCNLKTVVESVWGVPVIGALEPLDLYRATLQSCCRQTAPLHEICSIFAARFADYAREDPIRQILGRAGPVNARSSLFSQSTQWSGVRVAVAYDEAFHCYFAETLDILESRGARICDFSPLRDECVPEAEIVLLGCGAPERYAERLATNHCMLLSLRKHVCEGRLIYAEGGGAAYLSEFLQTPRREQLPMAGILPAVACLNGDSQPAEPVEATLATDTWLGPAGARLRGYLSRQWDFRPLAPWKATVVEPERRRDFIHNSQVIASRIHLDLAIQPTALPCLANVLRNLRR